MIRPIALIALLIGLTAPARALTPDVSHQHLIDTLSTYGVRTLINPVHCERGKMLGFTYGSIIGLCTDREPSYASFLDTIRHEAVHIAQACMAYHEPGTDPDGDGFAVLYPDGQPDWWLKYGEGIARHYDVSEWDIETEAFGMAGDFSAEQITNIVNIACSK